MATGAALEPVAAIEVSIRAILAMPAIEATVTVPAVMASMLEAGDPFPLVAVVASLEAVAVAPIMAPLIAIPALLVAVTVALDAIVVVPVAISDVLATVVVIRRSLRRRDGPGGRGGECEAQQAKTSMASHGKSSFPNAVEPFDGTGPALFGGGVSPANVPAWALQAPAVRRPGQPQASPKSSAAR